MGIFGRKQQPQAGALWAPPGSQRQSAPIGWQLSAPTREGDLPIQLAFVIVGGLVINKDDGTGEAQAFAKSVGIPILATIPADEDIRRKSANYEIIGRPESRWGSLFEDLATNVAEAKPHHPRPLTQDQLLGLFSGEAVGRDVVLVPASMEDMCGVSLVQKPSLEVIYDKV